MAEPARSSDKFSSALFTGPSFSALVTHEAGHALVYVTGDLDLATAPAFQREVVRLLDLPVDDVAIDLNRLEFVDSSGLHALNAIRIAAVAQGTPLMLQAVPHQARVVLEVSGMDELFADVLGDAR